MSENTSVRGFQFTPSGIAGILKTRRLRVPPYQREYAWTKDQVNKLYTDFTRAKNENSDYFLGTIVVVNRDRNEPLEIVDGQQRLSTTALLISSIRDYLKSIGQNETVLHSINNDYLSDFDRKQSSYVSKLTLNIDDHAFFASIINASAQSPALDPTRESHELLVSAKAQADLHVKNLARPFAEKDQPAALNDWLEFLEHSATVILVETPNSAQAFKMFETLNDRGLKTSQADLVKSYLFGQSGSRISEAQSRWSSMKDSLEEIDDDDRALNFLRHFIIATRKFVRAEEVYDHAQSIKGENNSVAFLTELEKYSRIYVATYRPSNAHWNGYNTSATKALSIYNKFDIKPLRPLVLALAVFHSPSEFSLAMTLLVSASVRLVVASKTSSGNLELIFASAALKVSQAEISTTRQLKENLKSILVSDADFKEAFQLARVTRAELARYYLRTLESANANER